MSTTFKTFTATDRLFKACGDYRQRYLAHFSAADGACTSIEILAHTEESARHLAHKFAGEHHLKVEQVELELY